MNERGSFDMAFLIRCGAYDDLFYTLYVLITFLSPLYDLRGWLGVKTNYLSINPSRRLLSNFEIYAINVMIPMFINQILNIFSVPAVTMLQIIPTLFVKKYEYRFFLTDGLISL